MKRALNIDMRIRVTERSQLFEAYKKGDWDLVLGTAYSSPTRDPTPMWQLILTCGGSQNWNRYCNPEFDKIVEMLNVESDTNERLKLIRQAEDILDEDVPQILLGFADHLPMWWNYVKGMGLENRIHTEWGRYDTFWIDK